nr:MAG TPA: hypothetical protein [Caudoviricetes sp.]
MKKLGNFDLVYFLMISAISFGGSLFHNVFANLTYRLFRDTLTLL